MTPAAEVVRSLTWVSGWDLPLHKVFILATTPDKPTIADVTSLIDDLFRKVSRVVGGGASRPETFILLKLRLLTTHFDRADTGAGYAKLHTFGAVNDTPFGNFSREFRVLVSAVTESEPVLVPGSDVVLEMVRMAVKEQFPTLMPTLSPGSKATNRRRYASLDAMRKAFSMAHNKIPAVNDETRFSLCLILRRERGHPLRRGPGSTVMGAARAKCRPSRFCG